MNSFSIACLRVSSFVFVTIGVIILFLCLLEGKAVFPAVRPIDAAMLTFLGMLGHVVCGIADKYLN